jgi:hypothetical protein
MKNIAILVCLALLFSACGSSSSDDGVEALSVPMVTIDPTKEEK